MSEQLKKPGVIIPVALFIVAAIVALILTVSPAPPRAQANLVMMEDIGADDVELLMLRIGATPQTLAAAGLTSNEAGNVVGYAHTFLEGHAGALASADNAVAQARAGFEALRRKARSGTASQQELTELTAAQQTLFTARGALADLLDDAREAAFADLTDTQKGVLSAVKSVSSQHCLGVPICAASRTETQWHDIRRAAGAIRSAQYSGQEPDPEAESVIDDAMGHADSIAAQANIEVRLAGVTAAVATALGNV